MTICSTVEHHSQNNDTKLLPIIESCKNILHFEATARVESRQLSTYKSLHSATYTTRIRLRIACCIPHQKPTVPETPLLSMYSTYLLLKILVSIIGGSILTVLNYIFTNVLLHLYG